MQFNLPPVIKNLLILNGLFYLAQLVPTTNEFLMQWFALWPLGTPDVVMTPTGPARIPDFWPWQLVSYGFLHSTQGISHILFNMFALWMFGAPLEQVWGARRFSLFYFVCVIGAGLMQLLVTFVEGGMSPTIGASGGVFGILLAFGMLFPDQPIYLYFLVPIKAKWVVIGYGVLEFFAGVAASGSQVAHFAHLGGMLFGFLVIMYWRGNLPIQPKRRMYP